MYKIGDKVETPLGVGVVVGKRVAMRYDDIIFEVEFKGIKIDFRNTQITAYRTAHEKLIEMGFVVVEDNVAWIAYEYKKAEYLIRFCKGSKQVGVYHDIDTNANYRYFGITLSRILTQYLEELNENTPK